MKFVAFRTSEGTLLDGAYVPSAAVDRVRRSVSESGGSGWWVGRCGAGVLACGAVDDLSVAYAVERRLTDAETISIDFDGSVCVLATDQAGFGALDGVMVRLFADPFATPSLARHEACSFTVSPEVSVNQLSIEETLLGLSHRERCVHALARSLESGQSITEVTSGNVAVARSSTTLGVVAPGALAGVRDLIEAVVNPTPICGRAVPAPVGSLDDGPARRLPQVIGLGFEFFDGRLQGPRDLFADRCFDSVRDIAWGRAVPTPPVVPVAPERSHSTGVRVAGVASPAR